MAHPAGVGHQRVPPRLDLPESPLAARWPAGLLRPLACPRLAYPHFDAPRGRHYTASKEGKGRKESGVSPIPRPTSYASIFQILALPTRFVFPPALPLFALNRLPVPS